MNLQDKLKELKECDYRFADASIRMPSHQLISLIAALEIAVIALSVYGGESIETDQGHCFFADNAIEQIKIKLGCV